MTTGKFSDGKEEFIVQKIINGIAHLFTKTGVKFLKAKKNDSIEIGENTLTSFLNDELKGFSKSDDDI